MRVFFAMFLALAMAGMAHGFDFTIQADIPVEPQADLDSHLVYYHLNGVVAGIEAEDGVVFGDFVVGDSATASGGKFVSVPNGIGNLSVLDETQKVTYTFDVPEGGTYRIKGYVFDTSMDNNSFFVKVNGLPDEGYLWDTESPQGWQADYVSHRDGVDPVEVTLSSGSNSLTVYLREDGSTLDKLEFELVGPVIMSSVPATDPAGGYMLDQQLLYTPPATYPDGTYVFQASVSSTDTSGNESALAGPVQKTVAITTVDVSPPVAPLNLSITCSVNPTCEAAQP